MINVRSSIGIILCICAILCESGCAFTDQPGHDELGREPYKVVEREDGPRCSGDYTACRVKVVLLHGNQKLYAIALGFKADINGETRYCNLHVGQTVLCKFFPDRHSEGATI